MAEVEDVAEYIINKIPVDNLKLQKLLYYCQAVHLVREDRTPLFTATIEAWLYGPVVPVIYSKYKKYGIDIIPRAQKGHSGLTAAEVQNIDMTLRFYGKFTGPELIDRTHCEAPWKDSYKEGEMHTEITRDSIYDYFKNALKFTKK